MAKRNEGTVEFSKVIMTRKSSQPQLNLSHVQVLELLDRAGAERPTKDTPLSLGSPSKGKAHLVWGCVTSGGEAFQIVQGDTHGVWLSHQDGAGREKFEALLTRLGVGKSALFRVVSVQYMPAGTEQAQDQEVAEIE